MGLQGNFATEIGALVDSLVTADKVNINETIFQQTFGVGSLTDSHTLVTDRRNGQLQPILLSGDYYGSMPGGAEQRCELNACDISPEYSTKKWTLGEYNCRLEICMRSFDENFLVFWNAYRQRLDDPTTSPDAKAFLDYLTEETEKRIQGTMWRTSYLGDISSENFLIDRNDGFFVQAEAGDGEKLNFIADDPENVTAEEIYEQLKVAYEYATNETLWGGEDDLVWKMTFATAAKLVSFLNTTSDLSTYNCDCINPDAVVAARRFRVDGLKVFGIPVEAHREIDKSIKAIGGGVVADKYKVLLTRKQNLLIGTNTTDKLEGFDVFYDKKDRKIYVDSMVYLGSMIPLDEYVYIRDVVQTGVIPA